MGPGLAAPEPHIPFLSGRAFVEMADADRNG